jgi:hypothetical protein
LLLNDAVRARRSIRAFRPDPVSEALVRELLEEARLAPSGTNIQPWKVHVVAGEARARLEREVLAHRETHPADTAAEFPRRSGARRDPYLTRMRTLGKAMYGLLEIPKGDQAANWRQWGRNYQFFDAPVGLIFTIDNDLDAMSFLDIGMFIQTLEQLLDGDQAGSGRAGRPVCGLRPVAGLAGRDGGGEYAGGGKGTRGRVCGVPRVLRVSVTEGKRRADEDGGHRIVGVASPPEPHAAGEAAVAVLDEIEGQIGAGHIISGVVAQLEAEGEVLAEPLPVLRRNQVALGLARGPARTLLASQNPAAGRTQDDLVLILPAD